MKFYLQTAKYALSVIGFLLLIFSKDLIAQSVPQYFNDNASANTSSIPLSSSTSRKIQWIYGPNVFNSNGSSGLPANSGYITKIFFRIGFANTSSNYSDLTISLAQNMMTQNNFTNVNFNPGMTTCFYQANNFQFTGATANSWFGIELQTPFLYNPNYSLIFEIQSSAGTGNFILTKNSSVQYPGIIGAYGTSTGSSLAGFIVDFGFDLAPITPCAGPPNAGIATASATSICLGQPFSLSLTNSSLGTGITYEWQSASAATGPWAAIPGANSSISTVSQLSTSFYRCVVTCANSLQSDTSTVTSVTGLGFSGTYTIGPTGDFPNFNAAINALSCGINGPVTFNVQPNSGPYNEQITIPTVINSSATNRVIFNGNGNTIQFGPTNNDRYLIRLDSASYITFNDLNVKSLNNYGIGFFLTKNSNHNQIHNCHIDLTSADLSTVFTTGILVAANQLEIGSGPTGNNNIFTNTTIKGGYAGIRLSGNSAANPSINNQVIGCTIEDFKFNGITLKDVSNSVFKNNEISCPTRANLSSFTGVLHENSGANNLFEGNKLHTGFGGVPASNGSYMTAFSQSNVTGTSIGNENFYINNVIYNMKNNGTHYGFHNVGSPHTKYYHNTISFDDVNATAGVTRGFFQTGTAVAIDFRNNIVSISRGGTGAKHCLYFGTTSSSIVSNNNVLFLNVPGPTSGIGYFGSNQPSLVNWKAVNSASFDQNSFDANPQFVSNFFVFPTNQTFKNLGAPLNILTDITGASRNIATPDIGAYEYFPLNKDVEIKNIFSSLAPCYDPNDTIKLSLKNIGSNNLDFAVDTLTIDWNVTGPVNASGTTQISTGTLFSGNTSVISFINPFNLSVPGTYQISASVVSPWDQIQNNNTTFKEITVDTVIVAASQDSVCSGTNVVLSLIGFMPPVQWQANTGTGFVNIPGATGLIATPMISSNTQFRALYCNNKFTDTLSVVEVTVAPPTVQNDTICVGNTGTLSATGSVVRWFTSPIGGNPIHIGNVFSATVPATTTYYAEARNGIVGSVGPFNTASVGTTGGTLSSQITVNHTKFDVLTPTTLVSVDIYPSIIGINGVIIIQDSSSTVLASVSYTSTVSGASTPQTVYLNVDLPPGKNYKIGQGYSMPLYRNTAGASYPYISPAIVITGNNVNPSTYFYFYNWKFNSGCISSRSPADIVVNQNPAISLPATANVCQGSLLTLGPAAPNASHVWSNNQTTPTIQVGTAGNYGVTVTDGFGYTATASVQVNVNPLPNVTANASSTEVCSGDAVTLFGSGSSLYSWSHGITNGVPFYASATTTYTVMVTDANNCTGSDSITVGVNPLPVVQANASATVACYGDSITLTGSGANTYTWDNNVIDGNPFPATTTKVYTVTGTDSKSCSATDQVTITVNPLPVVSAVATKTKICKGDSVTLTGTGADSYSWDKGVINNIAFSPTITNIYTVTGIDFNNCSNSFGISIEVNELPNVSLSKFDTLCVNVKEFKLTGGTPAGGFYNHQGPNPGIFEPGVVGIGDHIILYTFTDTNNCKNTASQILVVDQCTGINAFEVPVISVRIFPNPSFNDLTVEIYAISRQESEIMMFDAFGKLVLSEKHILAEGLNVLPVQGSEFARGIYYVRVNTHKSQVTQRIILQ